MIFRDDRLEVTFTYLEMRAPPRRPTARPPASKQPLMLLKLDTPTLSFYRYLYNAVGEPWLWYERRIMNDEQLGAILSDPAVEVHVLYSGGVPAGYAELNLADIRNIQLAYFGLVPDFIGRGLGRYFLEAIVDTAWSRHPDRLWLHTCTLDHPSALRNYQRRGFTPFDQKTRKVMDPRRVGYLPLNVGPKMDG